MKTIVAVSAGGVIVVLGLVWLFNGSSNPGTSAPQDDARATAPAVSTSRSGTSRPARVEAVPGDSVITKEQFDQMPPEDQNKAVEGFVASFWKLESAAPAGEAAQEQYLSLELFERPYMRSITEEEFRQLSPEEQQKAISEITQSCAETRTKVFHVIEQARTSIASNNPAMGEAYLISSLETGRELTAGRNGMLITRLTGIACQKAALKELAALYTNTGNHSRLQVMQGHLQDLDAEANEIRNTAQAAGR